MKKRYFVNGKSVMAAVGMAAALSIWGCGNGEGAMGQSVEKQGENEELESERTGEGDEGKEDERRGEGKEKENAGEGLQDADEAGRDAGPEGDSGRAEGVEAGERTELDGMIQEIEDGSFVMEQMVSELDESTGLVTVGGDPEHIGVIVDYTEETVFVRRVTTDGMTGTEEAGTRQDLAKDTIVHVTGIWKGDRFLAEEISVFVNARK